MREQAEVPKWEVGDNWKFISTYENSENYQETNWSYEVTVWDNYSFGDESFYQMSGSSQIIFNNLWVSKKDLRPIGLVDYENKTFNRTGMELNFPLYHGKKWNFTDLDGIDYNYSVEKVSDIEVPAGIFDGYKITKFIGNETQTITYYSPEIKFVFMKFHVEHTMSGNRTLKLHSYGNIETKRKLSTEELNNKYNARLEKWEFYSRDDYYPIYRLFYTYEGVEHDTFIYEGHREFLDNLINYTEEDDKILCWWDYGHMIRGYTGRDVIVDGPSERIWDTVAPWYVQNWNNDNDVMNVAKALTGTPEEAIEIMKQYNASLIYVGADDYFLSVNNAGKYSSMVKGANENPDDHYEIMAVLYDDELIPIEEALSGNYGWRWDGYSTKTIFKEPYYDSMIYRSRFGYCGADLGLDDGSGHPGISSEMNEYPIMPLWNLTNFKMIYRTAYWNPYPPDEVQNHTDAWIQTDYWDAYEKQEAGIGMSDFSDRSNLYQGNNILRLVKDTVITGTVKKNDGSPYSGIIVTVQDEYGIPKASTITDSQGRYELMAPYGHVKLVISEGEINFDRYPTYWSFEENGDYLLVQVSSFQETGDENGLLSKVGKSIWDSVDFIISEEIAEFNIITYQNFTEPGGLNYSGVIYKDLNKNNIFDGPDTPFANANYTLISNEFGNMTIQTDASGHFIFNQIPRGVYEFEIEIENHTTNRTQGSEQEVILFDWNAPDIEQNIGIPLVNITGTVSNYTYFKVDETYSNNYRITTNISGVNVTMLDICTNTTYVTITDEYGNYSFNNLLPGTYVLTCDHEYFTYDRYEYHLPYYSYARDIVRPFSEGEYVDLY